MYCWCSGCVPNDIPKDPWRAACSACGQEVRLGDRDGQRGWLHREAVDHYAVLGHRIDLSIDSNTLEVAEEGEDNESLMGPPEILAHPIDVDDLPPRSGIRQIANLVLGQGKAAPKDWELVNITLSRGHYMGAKGGSLGISDVHVLRARGPVALDGSRRVAVASWRDLKFDFAFIGILKDGSLSPHRVDSTTMKNWIKGTHDLPDAVQPPGE